MSGQTPRRIEVRVSRSPNCEDIPLPAYETEHAAGMDLRAAISEPLDLAPGQHAPIPTGLRIALPPGYEAQIRPRSGLAVRHGISLVNAPGTIDADYRGEIRVILINHGKVPYTVQRGDRIAQMVVAPVTRVEWVPTLSLEDTLRGEGGFGHTGSG